MSDGERYIEGLSIEQDLTFEKAKEIFKNANLAFGKAEYRTLGLIRADGRYSNLALLLSDQCKHTIKAAVFEGTTKAIFRDRKEFSGSLFSQLEDVFKYVDFYNKTNSTFKGLERIDKRDYPENAIREALLNSIIHREYSYSGSILVNLYDDRLEVVSLGGVVQGLTLDSIISGISQTRNEKLANIFYRLKFVEAYGTGIPRILDCYSNSRIKPAFKLTSSSFSVELPNLNYANNIAADISDLTEQEKNILNIIKSESEATRKQIMEKSGLGSTRSYNILMKLIKAGLIYTDKKSKETVYIFKK